MELALKIPDLLGDTSPDVALLALDIAKLLRVIRQWWRSPRPNDRIAEINENSI